MLHAVVQWTSHFVRAVRNGILGQLALKDVLGSLRMAMYAYLGRRMDTVAFPLSSPATPDFKPTESAEFRLCAAN
jgi:hypothetical protein